MKFSLRAAADARGFITSGSLDARLSADIDIAYAAAALEFAVVAAADARGKAAACGGDDAVLYIYVLAAILLRAPSVSDAGSIGAAGSSNCTVFDIDIPDFCIPESLKNAAEEIGIHHAAGADAGTRVHCGCIHDAVLYGYVAAPCNSAAADARACGFTV